MNITGVTEVMFSQAVALNQNGKMKSTIHCGENNIFIFNMDNTILLKYNSPQKFEQSFSFFANDYESPQLSIEAGQVIFESFQNGLRRSKTCPSPKTSYSDVLEMWKKFLPDKNYSVILIKDMSGMMDEGLSHIEISKKSGSGIQLLQRDIYSGQKILVEKSKSYGGMFEDFADDFAIPPVGIRTMDFGALFTFTNSLTWYFQPDKNWIYFEDNEGKLSGIIATCIYDEMSEVANVKE